MTALICFSEQKIRDFFQEFSTAWEEIMGKSMELDDVKNPHGKQYVMVLREQPMGEAGSSFCWFRVARTFGDGDDDSHWDLLQSEAMLRKLLEYPNLQYVLQRHFKEKK